MGKVLQPQGESHNLSEFAGKTIAVDVSICMIQSCKSQAAVARELVEGHEMADPEEAVERKLLALPRPRKDQFNMCGGRRSVAGQTCASGRGARCVRDGASGTV